jgi:hypothetical protein
MGDEVVFALSAPVKKHRSVAVPRQRRWMGSALPALLAAALIALAASSAVAQPAPPPGPGAVEMAPYAPPPPRIEAVPPPPVAPQPLYWVPGRWQWDGRGWIWIPGHYVARPPHRAHWVPGHWVARPGGWFWVEGHWR